ncbi:MAG: carboxypeptidase-like regulatory domain-containing protein [Bacteroidetes bacterium]|nr:carboxypeptidase-like regulatory domain-containing protein [Bacteroidota bacterium]
MKYFVKITFLVFVSLYLTANSYAQENERRPVQFSGVVIRGEDLKPIPYTSILVKNLRRGTISDFYGFFSFVAQEGDIIEFTALGYKKATFVIPDSLTQFKYSLIQVMTSDTIMLNETVIYPWPTLEQFKKAFVELKIPDDDLERAKKNLALAELKENFDNISMDGSMNYKNFMNNQQSKLYYAGQMQPNNLLNPIAWAQFIKAWREGKFKKKS